MRMGNKGLGIYDVSTVGMILLMVGVTLSIGAYVNSSMQTAMPSTALLNESVTFVNRTFVSLNYGASGITSITNETDSIGTQSLGSGNWTTGSSGFLTKVNVTFVCTAGYCQAGVWNVTYGSYSSATQLMLQNSTSAIAQFSSWLPIIAIVAAAGVILGVLTLAFARKQEGGV